MHFLKNRFPSELTIIILLFIIWKVFLSGMALIGYIFVHLASRNFLGGGYDLYNRYVYLMPWANFDGEHYLSISMIGYRSLEQAFFPLYPLLIHLGGMIFNSGFITSVSSGLVVSNLCFIVSLYLVYKLVKLDYTRYAAWLTVVLFLVFPTSFFFGAFYTESLFLLLSVGTFYFYRKQNYLVSGIMGFLAAFTRVFGVLLFFALMIDIWQSKTSLKKVWPILFIPGGLLLYMGYLWWSVGDPLAFYNLQSIIGEHRGRGIVLFPQVVYRYLNILVQYRVPDIFLASLLLEFVATLMFVFLTLIGYVKKMRLSYLFYALASILLPTVQGSFSSGSRYVLVVFPVFIVAALLMEKWPRWLQGLVLSFSLVLLGFYTILFIRGYWVA